MKETYSKPKLDIIIEIPVGPGAQDDENPNNGDIIIGGSNTAGDDDGGL